MLLFVNSIDDYQSQPTINDRNSDNVLAHWDCKLANALLARFTPGVASCWRNLIIQLFRITENRNSTAYNEKKIMI